LVLLLLAVTPELTVDISRFPDDAEGEISPLGVALAIAKSMFNATAGGPVAADPVRGAASVESI
jgi:hypothetical protein